MSSRHDAGWNEIYHRYRPQSLPWELGRPRRILIELVESGGVATGKALDLCCGAGTNPVYMAMKGFDVTALDVSDKAVEYAKEQALRTNIGLNLLVADFLRLPFRSNEFDFVFDFGCFHHVERDDRKTFIKSVYRVLRPKGKYLLVCFSHRNGKAWNHFTKEQILKLFGKYFKIEWIRHVSSIEGDNITRHFFETLMDKSSNQ